MKSQIKSAALALALLSPAAVMAVAPVHAQPSDSQSSTQVVQAPVQEARIPFPSTIRDYRADGSKGIYLLTGKQWYYGTFMSSCTDLPFAMHVGFKPSPTGVDRYSTIVIPAKEECALQSLVKFDGTPPPKPKKGK